MNIFETVSYHLWKPCNMRCKFCYATFQDIPSSVLPKGHQTEEECLEMIYMLADVGVKKITFAGGEPTLCKFLPNLVQFAKEMNLATGIITNGSLLNESYLLQFVKHLDWIGLSVDSLIEDDNIATGRAIRGRSPLSKGKYYYLAKIIREMGFKLKINTVVHHMNWGASMNEFISIVNPDRWKVFQVLPIEGQNSGCVDKLLIDDRKFEYFLHNHRYQKSLVPESNELMTGSYLLVDPMGRFFENSKGKHTYSRQIATVGVEEALKDIELNRKRFLERGGIYQW